MYSWHLAVLLFQCISGTFKVKSASSFPKVNASHAAVATEKPIHFFFLQFVVTAAKDSMLLLRFFKCCSLVLQHFYSSVASVLQFPFHHFHPKHYLPGLLQSKIMYKAYQVLFIITSMSYPLQLLVAIFQHTVFKQCKSVMVMAFRKKRKGKFIAFPCDSIPYAHVNAW